MKLRERAQHNPAMALLTTLAAIAVAVVSIHQGVFLADELVLTEAEAGVIHAVYDQKIAAVGQKIDAQALLNECRWLSDQINQTEYEIYVLDRDGASADFIQSKRTILRQRTTRYAALLCAKHLT